MIVERMRIILREIEKLFQLLAKMAEDPCPWQIRYFRLDIVPYIRTLFFTPCFSNDK